MSLPCPYRSLSLVLAVSCCGSNAAAQAARPCAPACMPRRRLHACMRSAPLQVVSGDATAEQVAERVPGCCLCRAGGRLHACIVVAHASPAHPSVAVLLCFRTHAPLLHPHNLFLCVHVTSCKALWLARLLLLFRCVHMSPPAKATDAIMRLNPAVLKLEC